TLHCGSTCTSRFGLETDQLSVYENLFDADGKFLRLGESGAVDHGGRIEENQVGECAFPEDTAIFPVEPVSGQRSHFADGFRQWEPVIFADEAAEHAWESPSAARMFRSNPAVAGHHDPRLLVKHFYVLFDHGVADN